MVRRPISLLLCLAMSIAGCANHTQELYANAKREHRIPVVFDTDSYRIQAVLPQVRTEHLRIYIEGDGKAWATKYQPSTDPTPTVPLVSKLAAADPAPSAYLARPCQYISSDRCNNHVWTDRRFSREAVASVSKAVDQAKNSTGAATIDLVGYSGGGALALLIAAQRDDVTSVQTLAGNLTPAGWVRQQGLSPLQDALEPADFAQALRHIPQRHLVGGRDKTIPPSLAAQYAASFGHSNCLQIVSVNASHEDGWQSAWATYRDTSINCGTTSELPNVDGHDQQLSGP